MPQEATWVQYTVYFSKNEGLITKPHKTIPCESQNLLFLHGSYHALSLQNLIQQLCTVQVHPIQGSLVFPKIEISINADMRGLSFL